MINFVRSFCILISSALYMAIPRLYSLFHGLAAEPMLFDTAEVTKLTNNIYTLVSVVMLFAFATKAISAIVNPDNLWDKKKGVGSVIKRSVIALVLIIAIPFGFHYFYIFQTKIVNDGLIEKLILGIDMTSNEDGLTEEEREKYETVIENIEDYDTKKRFLKIYTRSSAAYKIGQSLAQETLSATLYPPNVKCEEPIVKYSSGIGDAAANTIGMMGNGNMGIVFKVFTGLTSGLEGVYTKIKGESTGAGSSLCEIYNSTISVDIDYIRYLVSKINTTTLVSDSKFLGEIANEMGDSKYFVLEYDYWGLLSVLAGGAIVYFLVIFCIDCAVRLIKMAFLEITAPISVMAYIFGGNEVLKKWFKELYTTAISFFLRVAAISFLALVLTNIDKFVDNLPSYYYRLAKIFIIIGALIFAKKVPETLERAFGIKITPQGGIGGRLGQMLGVGKIAQNAWKTLGSTAGKAVKATATLPLLGAGAAIGFGAKKFDKEVLDGKGKELVDKFKESRISAGASAVGTLYKNGGGIKGIKAAADSYNKNPAVVNAKYIKESADAKKKADEIKNKISAAGEDSSIGLYEKEYDPKTGDFIGYKYDDKIIKLLSEEQYKDRTGDLIDKVGKDAKLNTEQIERLKKAEEALIDFNNAKNKSDSLNKVTSYLSQLKTATTSQVAKQKIQNLVDSLNSGNEVDVTEVAHKLHDIRKIATVSKFTVDAADGIKNNITTGSVDSISSAINSLNEQLSHVTDSGRRAKINEIIGNLTNAKDAKISSDLAATLHNAQANVSLNTVDGFDKAISDLNSQLSNITDASVKGNITSLISSIENEKKAATARKLESIMAGVRTDVSKNTTTGFNDAITKLKQQLTVETDASTISDINNLITKLETNRLSATGPGTPVDPSILSDIQTIETNAHTVASSSNLASVIHNISVEETAANTAATTKTYTYTDSSGAVTTNNTFNVNDTLSDINNVQYWESVNNSVFSEDSLNNQVSLLQNAANVKVDQATGMVTYDLKGQSTIKLSNDVSDRQEDLDKAQKKVDEVKEKSSKEQKSYIDGIQKQLKEIEKRRNR